MYNRGVFSPHGLLALALGIQFVDVAKESGLDFHHLSGSPKKDYILETISGGVAWIDYDSDGWPDLYLVNGGRWEDLKKGKRSVSNALFHNNGNGTFTDVTLRAGVANTHWGMGATVADYDNDGRPDLYVCNYGPNTLYRNRGDGTFEDVTASAGVGHSSWDSSAAFGDYDGDGRLDLYVADYVRFDSAHAPPPRCQYRGIQVHCGPKGMVAAPDVLYHNKGDGTFSDVTRQAGVAVPPAYGLGVLWLDYDDDGDPDLVVANDSMANFLFQNQGNGSFQEVGLLAGVAYNEDGKAQASMGLAWGDYDHDGALDLFMTHFSDDYNTLYRNLGQGIFRDVTYAAGLAFPSWQYLAWGTGFLDYDNDGWEDLFISNGHIYPQVDDYQIGTSFLQVNQLFRNLGNGKFQEKGARMGGAFRQILSSRGAALADYDNDGDVDIAVNNMDSPPSLLRNEGGNQAGHWITLALEGVHSNRTAAGARVTLETSDTRRVQELQAGSSYQASHDLRLHFGLGKARRVQSLQVRWPSGAVQTFANLEGDHHYQLREGDKPIFQKILEPPLSGGVGKKPSSR
ncbi:MAG: CRTAC1 family protein [Acidobacteriota bacterium]